MTNSYWWQASDVRPDLEDGLAHLNSGRAWARQDRFVDACEQTFKGLNRVWNTHARVSFSESELAERKDAAQFARVLLAAPEGHQRSLLGQSAVADLAELSPILDHSVLARSAKYRPGKSTPPELERVATKEHREFRDSLNKWVTGQGSPRATVRAFTRLLYVVRSNIAHGWKTRYGPDQEAESRDRIVCASVFPVLVEVADIVLGLPGRRLGAYGTLQPDGPGATLLEGTEGVWHRGIVKGHLEEIDGLAALRWLPVSGDTVPVAIFESDDLPAKWATLDRFEGERYLRVLCTAEVDAEFAVINVYAASDR